MARRGPSWTPSDEQMRLWPSVSGNTINGLGEADPRRPSPIYWHPPESTPHGPLQRWFYGQNKSELVAQARQERQLALDEPLLPLAPEKVERAPEEWSAQVKRAGRESGADLVGVTRFREEWVFEGSPAPTQKFVIMLGVGQDCEAMKTAPEEQAAAEVSRQYARGTRAAKGLASWLRSQGHDAHPHGGPMAGPMVLIPAALACGFGELGKHGSIINRRLGSSFRLACVLTDVPLAEDAPDDSGADDFCTRCQLCSDACPPDALRAEKQRVRGETRWYVDFDRCLPFFNEHMGCAICIAVCPWSRPGVAANLVEKLARRRGQG